MTASLRQDGVDRFRSVGLPSRKIEAWHYTDLSQSGVTGFAMAEPPAGEADTATADIHLVNGFLVGRPSLPDGVTLDRLDASVDGKAQVGQLVPAADFPMAALNAGAFADAFVLTVAAGTQIDRPIVIRSEGRATAEGLQFHGRLLLLVEPGAAVTVIETHDGVGRYFSNHVCEMQIAENARLLHVLLQNEAADATHVGTLGIALAKDAAYCGVVLHLGGRLVRHELQAVLAGPGAAFSLDGASLVLAGQHIDNTTRVIHRAPHCDSRQLFKTVLDQDGHGVFQGTVLVERPAQKTKAHQLSRALMLSDRAAMDNKPELEIFADDVKCGHGATIGDIDDAALFYLRARGIDEQRARKMLVEAFLAEVIDQVAMPDIGTQLGDLMRQRLGALTLQTAARSIL